MAVLGDFCFEESLGNGPFRSEPYPLRPFKSQA